MGEDPHISDLRERLKSAVRNQRADREFEEDLRSEIRARSSTPFFGIRRALAATAAILLFGAGIAVHSRQGETQGMLRIGIGDHIRCAVLGRAEQRRMDGRFAALPLLVASTAPAGYRMVSAHQCDFEGRSLAHLVFRNGTSLLSLIVAPGLDLEFKGAERISTPDGRFAAAMGEGGERFVFVVSDMAVEDNHAAAESMMPVVLGFLRAAKLAAGSRSGAVVLVRAGDLPGVEGFVVAEEAGRGRPAPARGPAPPRSLWIIVGLICLG